MDLPFDSPDLSDRLFSDLVQSVLVPASGDHCYYHPELYFPENEQTKKEKTKISRKKEEDKQHETIDPHQFQDLS